MRISTLPLPDKHRSRQADAGKKDHTEETEGTEEVMQSSVASVPSVLAMRSSCRGMIDGEDAIRECRERSVRAL